MRSSLTRRLDALEERHTSEHGTYAAGVKNFHTKMLDLIARSEHLTPDPATMSEAEQIACLAWTDPEEAERRLKATARHALERQRSLQKVTP